MCQPIICFFLSIIRFATHRSYGFTSNPWLTRSVSTCCQNQIAYCTMPYSALRGSAYSTGFSCSTTMYRRWRFVSIMASNSVILPSNLIRTHSPSIGVYRNAPGTSIVTISLFSFAAITRMRSTASVSIFGDETSFLFVHARCLLPSAQPLPSIRLSLYSLRNMRYRRVFFFSSRERIDGDRGRSTSISCSCFFSTSTAKTSTDNNISVAAGFFEAYRDTELSEEHGSQRFQVFEQAHISVTSKKVRWVSTGVPSLVLKAQRHAFVCNHT